MLIIAAAYFCYRLAFSVPKQSRESLFEMPDTEQYAPYRDAARQMISEALEIPYKEVTVTSYDGLCLFGKCYFANKSAPWLIMMHGYRSGAERDFCGGLKFGIEAGFNVLLVDQRAHGKSEGKCLTFGIKERRDCLSWVNYVVSKAGENCEIVLYGMSMGAATVLMAAGLDFEIEGLEELERDLTKAIQTAPEKAKETLKGIGKDFKNAAKKRANSELKPHERTGSEKNKAIKRKWGTKVIEENVGATALVWNSARHFHLIENGHNLVRGGRIVGFVPGKHIMEKTRNEYENIVPQRFEEMIDEILKEGDLN